MNGTPEAGSSVERLASLVADLQTELNRADRAAAGDLGVGSAEDLQVLRLLSSDGPLRVGELAKRRGSSMTTISGRLNRLEKKGLIERRRIPGDRRAMEVTLTAAGVEHARLSREQRMAALGTVADGYQLEALAELVAALRDGAWRSGTDRLV